MKRKNFSCSFCLRNSGDPQRISQRSVTTLKLSNLVVKFKFSHSLATELTDNEELATPILIRPLLGSRFFSASTFD